MRTIPSLWQAATAAPHPFAAFRVREENGEWRDVSFADAERAVDEIAAGLLALGVAHGDRAGLLSRTRLEWTLCDYALASIGAVSVPVYPTSSARETAHVLRDSGARLVLCEDGEQYAKIAGVRNELPALELAVVFDGGRGSGLALDEVRERGRAALAEQPDAVEAERRRIAEDDVLTIIYTSGTTGPPKGCVLTHRHYSAMVEMIRQVPGLFADADVVLLYLPLAHNFARLVQYAGAGVPFTVAFCPDTSIVAQALKEVRPTIFPSVPRAFEKAHAAVRDRIEQSPAARRRLAEWALRVGARRQRGLAYGVADRLVLSRVRAQIFGDRLRVAVSGGAALSRELAEFFHSLGVLVLEGYGLTEFTTASHVNQPARYRFGTVGLPLPGVEVLIADDGEILLRGETVFAGYHGDAEATAAVLDADGWLHTGDIGFVDADGFLAVTDRRKDIIITAGGKNLSPQNLEIALRSSRYIAQALVIGDGRPFVTALLVPETAELQRVAGSASEARAVLEREVADVNRDLGRVEQIKRFAVLDRDFSAEDGELTPTLKLRRHVVEEHFRDEIEALYASA